MESHGIIWLPDGRQKVAALQLSEDFGINLVGLDLRVRNGFLRDLLLVIVQSCKRLTSHRNSLTDTDRM